MDDREAQRERMEKSKILRAADLRWLAGSAAGKRILSSFFRLQRSKPFSGQADVTAYNLGKVDVAREFLDDIRTADLELYQAAEAFSFQEA